VAILIPPPDDLEEELVRLVDVVVGGDYLLAPWLLVLYAEVLGESPQAALLAAGEADEAPLGVDAERLLVRRLAPAGSDLAVGVVRAPGLVVPLRVGALRLAEARA